MKYIKILSFVCALIVSSTLDAQISRKLDELHPGMESTVDQITAIARAEGRDTVIHTNDKGCRMTLYPVRVPDHPTPTITLFLSRENRISEISYIFNSSDGYTEDDFYQRVSSMETEYNIIPEQTNPNSPVHFTGKKDGVMLIIMERRDCRNQAYEGFIVTLMDIDLTTRIIYETYIQEQKSRMK